MKSAFAGLALVALCAPGAIAAERGAPVAFDSMIARHAAANGVPEELVRRVVVRESKYNPAAYNRGHYGLMQIKHQTARAMGYHGSPQGLLDAETNLTYGIRYLAGAYKVARGDHNRAVRFYASGYYYDAKRQGLLAQIGLGRNAKPFPTVASATPAATSAPAAPTRVIATNAQPVLAAMTPVAATSAAPTAAPARPQADGAAVNARIAAAGDAVGGFGRVASAAPAASVRDAQAFAEARALGAPAALVEMRGPSRPMPALIPLPPVGRPGPAVATAAAASAKTPAASVAAAPVLQTASLAQPGVPLPPMREPSTATGSVNPAPAAAARPEPRRYRGPK
nr:lytic transglycosylase domain-containing protein [Methylopila sp. 73B]